METLKEKTAKGLFWGIMNNGTQLLVGLVVGIALGRLLSPDDYGMIAMISIFSLVATTLQNSGFSLALANLKSPTHEDYNSVFWFNIIVGFSLYALLFACAPLIAMYYRDERLVALCRYAFLSLPLASLATAQSAFLFKNLMAKRQAQAGVAAVLLSSAVGVAMAFGGFAYWALATQSLVFVGSNMVLTWLFSPWRPTLHIDFGPARRMFRFGGKVLATAIVGHVNNNVLNILLGRYFSAHATGCYNQANQWNSKCCYLVNGMISQVAQPVLVSLRDERGRQLNALRKLARFTAFVSFPLLFGLSLVSKEFIVLAITSKWLASAELLQIVCIGGAVLPLHNLLSNMVLAGGRSGTFFWCTLTLGVVEIAAMVCLWPLGIKAMVIAHTALMVVWLFVWHFFVSRIIGYTLALFLKDILPFALIAGATMVATHFITAPITSLALQLMARIALAAALYYAALRLAHAKILAECEGFIKEKIHFGAKGGRGR